MAGSGALAYWASAEKRKANAAAQTGNRSTVLGPSSGGSGGASSAGYTLPKADPSWYDGELQDKRNMAAVYKSVTGEDSPGGPVGLLTGALDFIDRGRAALTGLGTGLVNQAGVALEGVGVDNALDEWTADTRYDDSNQGDDNHLGANSIDNTLGRFWSGLSGETKYGIGDFKQGFLNFQEDDGFLERAAKSVGTFGLETVTDPLTYLTFGAGVVGKAAVTGSLRATTRGFAENASEETIEAVAKRNTGSTKTTVKEVAEEQFLNEATTAYTRYGARGLQRYLFSESGLPREQAEALYKSLSKDLKGGVRASIPFTNKQTSSITAGFLNNIAPVERALDRGADVRNKLAMNPLSAFVRKNLSGEAGGAWDAFRRQVADGEVGDFGAYDTAKITARDARTRGAQLAEERKVIVSRLGARLAQSQDPTQLKAEIDLLVGNKGQGEVTDEAREIYNDYILAPIQEAYDNLVAMGGTIGKLEDFDMPRIVKPEYRSKKYESTRREAFITFEDTSEGVANLFASLFRANEMAGKDLFETDILKILPEYLSAIHGKTQKAYLLNGMRQAGLLTDEGVAAATVPAMSGNVQQSAAGALNKLVEAQSAARELDPEAADAIGVEVFNLLGYKSPAQFVEQLAQVPVEQAQAQVNDLLDVMAGTVKQGARTSKDYDAADRAGYVAAQEAERLASREARDAAKVAQGVLRSMQTSRVKGSARVVKKGARDELPLLRSRGDDVIYQSKDNIRDAEDARLETNTNRAQAQGVLDETVGRLADINAGLAASRRTPVSPDTVFEELSSGAKLARRDGTTAVPNEPAFELLNNSMRRAAEMSAKLADSSSLLSERTDALEELLIAETQDAVGQKLDLVAARAASKEAREELSALRQQHKELKKDIKFERQMQRSLTAGVKQGADQTADEVRAAQLAELQAAVIRREQARAVRDEATEERLRQWEALRERRKASAEGRSDFAAALRSISRATKTTRKESRKTRVSSSALNDWAKDRGEVVLVERYGDKRYVSGSPFNDRNTANEVIVPMLQDIFRARDDRALTPFMDTFVRPYLTVFKTTATVGRGPGYHIRNVAGGLVNLMVVGATGGDLKLATKVWRAERAAKEAAGEVLAGKDKAWEKTFDRVMRERLGDEFVDSPDGPVSLYDVAVAARDKGLYYNNRTLDELGMDLRNPSDSGADPVKGMGPDRINPFFQTKEWDELNRPQRAVAWTVNNSWVRWNSSVAQSSENWLRTAAFVRGVRNTGKNDNYEGASTLMKASQFDYGDLSGFEQDFMKMLIPFYTWSRNNVPLQFRVLLTNPRYPIMLERAHEGVAGVLEDTSAEGQEMADNLPGFAKNRFSFVSKIGAFGGAPISIGLESPFNDLNSNFSWSANPAEQLDTFITNQASGANPALKGAYEQVSGVDTFAKTPFGEKGVSAPGWMSWLSKVPGTPLVKEDQDGRVYTSPFLGNTLGDMLPWLGLTEGLTQFGQPVDENDTRTSKWASTLFGLPVSTATDNQMAAEMNKQNKRMRATLDTEQDLRGIDESALLRWLPQQPTQADIALAANLVRSGYFNKRPGM